MNKNEYILTINIEGGVSGESPIASEESQPTIENNKSEKVILTAYGMAKPFIDKTEQVIMNNVKTQYANEEYEMRLQMLMDFTNTGINAIAGMAAGQTIATALGISSPFGAVVGATLTLLNKGAEILVNQNRINNARIVENEGLDILRGRAGIQFNKSRSGQ